MRYEEEFIVSNVLFRVSIEHCGEVLLERLTPSLDEMLEENSGFSRDKINPKDGAKVYLKARSIIKELIHNNKIPVLKWNIAMDESRKRLYASFAKSLSKMGYECVNENNEIFWCYLKS